MIDDNKTNDLYVINGDGSVTVNGADFTETWRPWGHPRGFGVEGCKRASYNGQSEPLLCTHIIKVGDVGGPLQVIADSIPNEVRQAGMHFLHWPVEHIQLAECNPRGYLNLAQQNPALLNHLASLSANHTLWGPTYWGELLGGTQRHIALQIGLLPGQAKYLSRIPDDGLLVHGYLSIAMTAYRQIGMARYLQHVKHINLDVTLLAFTHGDVSRRCPSLLHLASELPPFSTLVSEDVAAICSMNQAARRPSWPWRKIKSLGQLRDIRTRLAEESILEGRGDAIQYPPPPLSPCSDWSVITNSEDLHRHSRVHCNCALQENWRIMAGELAIYESRHSSPLDTIIVVLMQSEGRWHVQDVLGTHNSLVDPVIEAQVREEFNSSLNGGAA